MSWFPAGEYSIIPWGGRIFTVTNQLRRSSMRIKREKTRVRQEKEKERERKNLVPSIISRQGTPKIEIVTIQEIGGNGGLLLDSSILGFSRIYTALHNGTVWGRKEEKKI